MTSLIDFPEKVMEKVLEKLDFVEIQILRKTCHSIRNFIDDVTPDYRISKNRMEINSDEISIELEFDEKSKCIKFQNIENGCKISHENREIFLENSDFAEIFFADFTKTLSGSKRTLENFEMRYSGNMNLLNRIEIFLKNRPRPLLVNSVKLIMKDQDQFLKILPYLDPESLEYIILFNLDFDDHEKILKIDKFVELEQWRKAENLQIWNFWLDEKLEHFVHFKNVNISYLELKVEDVVFLKNTFTNSPNFTLFATYFKNFPEKQDLIRLFSPSIDNNDYFKKRVKRWIFKCRDTVEKVLSITLFKNFMTFERIDLDEIPENAEIKDQ